MAEMKFAGTTMQDTVKWEDLFDVDYNDDGYLNLTGKKLLHHDGDDDVESFDFRFAIAAVDMYRATKNPDVKEIDIRVCIAVDPACWSKYLLDSAADINGWNGMPYEELRGMINVQDMLECGGIATIGHDSVPYEEEEEMEIGWYNILDNPDAVQKLNAATAYAKTMETDYVSALDMTVNMIGTTVMDVIQGAVKGYDPYLKTLGI